MESGEAGHQTLPISPFLSPCDSPRSFQSNLFSLGSASHQPCVLRYVAESLLVIQFPCINQMHGSSLSDLKSQDLSSYPSFACYYLIGIRQITLSL